MSIGWIKLHRKFLNWGWYDDHITKALFLHLLLNANLETKHWHEHKINRGEVFTSIKKLEKELNMTTFQVRNSLNKLYRTGEIIKNPSKKSTHIYITNFECYQKVNDCLQVKPNIRHNTISSKKQQQEQFITSTTKEVKEIKNIRSKEENNILNLANEALFEEFWASYTPVCVDGKFVAKGSKIKAKTTFLRILSKGETYEKIKQGLQRYLKYCQENGRNTCGVNVFLTQQRWLDEYGGNYSINVKSTVYKRSNNDSKVKAIAKLFD